MTFLAGRSEDLQQSAIVGIQVLDANTAKVTVTTEDRPGLMRVRVTIDSPIKSYAVMPLQCGTPASTAEMSHYLPPLFNLPHHLHAIQDVSSAISKLNLSIENATIITSNEGVEDTFLVKVSDGIVMPLPAFPKLLRSAPDHMVTHIPGISTSSGCCLIAAAACHNTQIWPYGVESLYPKAILYIQLHATQNLNELGITIADSSTDFEDGDCFFDKDGFVCESMLDKVCTCHVSAHHNSFIPLHLLVIHHNERDCFAFMRHDALAGCR